MVSVAFRRVILRFLLDEHVKAFAAVGEDDHMPLSIGEDVLLGELHANIVIVIPQLILIRHAWHQDILRPQHLHGLVAHFIGLMTMVGEFEHVHIGAQLAILIVDAAALGKIAGEEELARAAADRETELLAESEAEPANV